MKIRTNFVSNSSSSSFVLVGTKINNINQISLAEKLLEKFPNERYSSQKVHDESWAWDVLYSLNGKNKFGVLSETGSGDLIGYILYSGSIDDGGIEDFSVELSDLKEKSQEVHKLLLELGLPGDMVKLYAGSRSC
jgi:hypothetical protein